MTKQEIKNKINNVNIQLLNIKGKGKLDLSAKLLTELSQLNKLLYAVRTKERAK